MSKPFPLSIVEKAFERSGGRCECTREVCGHSRRCTTQLFKGSRGKETPQGWEAHHINSNGEPVLSNCQILCQECHKNTRSFGRH